MKRAQRWQRLASVAAARRRIAQQAWTDCDLRYQSERSRVAELDRAATGRRQWRDRCLAAGMNVARLHELWRSEAVIAEARGSAAQRLRQLQDDLSRARERVAAAYQREQIWNRLQAREADRQRQQRERHEQRQLDEAALRQAAFRKGGETA